MRHSALAPGSGMTPMTRSHRKAAYSCLGTNGVAPRSEAQAHPLFRRGLPLRRKLAFAVPTGLGIVVALELALWACGVKPAYYSRDPYAGFTPQVPHFQVETTAGGEAFVTVVPSKRESLNEQHFLRHKPTGKYRIV